MRSGAAATAEVVGRAEAEAFMQVVEAEASGAGRREDSAALRVALAVAAVIAARLAVVPIVARQVTATVEGDLSLGQRIAEARTEAATAAEHTPERTAVEVTARIEDRHFPAAGILEMRVRVHVMCVAAWPMASGVPLQDREDLQGSQAREVPRMARPRAFATRALP